VLGINIIHFKINDQKLFLELHTTT
jgi:hypothetical protein